MVQTVTTAFFGLVAIAFGVGVFRSKSMVRSALSLLGSMAAIGALFLTMQAEFLGVLQLMMMGSEMAIMAIFMVMYMMDPGGLGQMEMTHQKRTSYAAGIIGAAIAIGVTFFVDWGPTVAKAPDPITSTHDLGIEMMTRSMLIFETTGFTILVAMIAATVVAIARHK
ncbi:MAG: NADH-quinone oxidoreductase subunit J [Chloroflexota bacterium]|nr:NADH-quinone oxidoreductase subunit J [Chloroflexota bacterium]